MSLPLANPIVRPNLGGRKPDTPTPTWRERLRALRHLRTLLRLVWSTEPSYVVEILVLRVARAGQAGVQVAVLWVGKLIVDQVVAAIGQRQVPWGHLAVLLAIEFAIAVVGEGLSRLSALLESLLGDLFANRTSVDLMRHAAKLDLEQFEDADLYDTPIPAYKRES